MRHGSDLVFADQSIRMEGATDMFVRAYRELQYEELRPWVEVSPWGTAAAEGWDVWGFWGFGKRIEENCARFPECAKLIEEVFPGRTQAGFSRLRPGAYIRPHTHTGENFYTSYKVFHLGLLCPGGAAIRVEDLIYEWKAGEAFCFDASKEHETWNRSEHDRIILMIAF